MKDGSQGLKWGRSSAIHLTAVASLLSILAMGIIGCEPKRIDNYSTQAQAAQAVDIQQPQAAEIFPSSDPKQARIAHEIMADPVRFMHQVADRVAKLEQYRFIFYRQERLGSISPKLAPMEEIETTFRQRPFSVKFVWDDPATPYFESVYVEGQNDNKLLVRERKGALPLLAPQVRAVDVMFPVKIGKCKNPVTDFGLDRLMQRSLLTFNDPEVARATAIQYKGLIMLEPSHRPAFYLRIDRPKSPNITYTRQDLYFDAQTLLPAGTDVYLPGDVLDGRYRYVDVNTDVQISDADFSIGE